MAINNYDYAELKKVIKEVIKEQNIALLTMADVIDSTGSNTKVLLAGYETNITIPNKTNLTLVANDKVVCVALNGDFSNIFVGWKL